MPETVSILTPPGVGAIAVVRLHGDGVASFIEKHLSKPPVTGRCVHADLRDGHAVIDDPVVVQFDARTVDLSLHGGPWIVSRTVELARQAGFVEVLELDANDVEAEMLLELPRALTRDAVAILLAQPNAWREMFDRNDRDAMERAREDRALHHLLNPPTVAIVGAPNVGKSTLANHLFGRERSITADLPGTTRDWVGEQANLDGLVVTLVDTPGQRDTADPIEREAIARSKAVIQQADLVVRVLDATTAVPGAHAKHELLVINKVDRGLTWEVPGATAISAITGAGIDELRMRIRHWFGCGDLKSAHARAWTHRQRELLMRM